MTPRDTLYLGTLLRHIFLRRSKPENQGIDNSVLSEASGEKLSPELNRIMDEAETLVTGGLKSESELNTQQPQVSIFSKLDFSESAATYTQPVSRLTPDGYVFPSQDGTTENPALESQWNAFFTEANTVSDTGTSAGIETVRELMKKYLWCMPSAFYKHAPDISMYEDVRLSAALAVCLFGFLQAKHTGENIPESGIAHREEARYRLMCADVTGIQRFIYSIAHKGAAKALKGRSFFLQHLCDAFADDILKKLKMYRANLIYSSGGKFYLLLPNTDEAADVLRDREKAFNEKLLETYHGDLGIVFASLPLTGEDFYLKRIAEKWDDLGKALERSKRRKFATQFSSQFFRPNTAFGSVELCWATGKELCNKSDLSGLRGVPETVGAQTFEKLETRFGNAYFVKDEGHFISEEQFTAQRLGYRLRDAERLIMSPTVSNGFSALGFGAFTVAASDVGLRAEREILLNDDHFMRLAGQERGFKFYGGNWSLEKDYDALADDAEGGLKHLGVLRMDVDNLGKIFQDGFKDGKDISASFSHVVQLSAMLDFFFTGYLNTLASLKWSVELGVNDKEGNSLKTLMQIVYAGGDDVFIVGVWNVLPDVARWIAAEFQRFTCRNEKFSLSAGITLFDRKFPLYKAAHLAGDAEAQAKGFSRKLKNKTELVSKNAICFLDTPVSWHDFEVVSELTRKLYRWTETGKDGVMLSRAILNALKLIYAEYDGEIKRLMHSGLPRSAATEQAKYSRWRWRACYALARFGERQKAFKEELGQLSSELFLTQKTEQDMISLIHTAATWAEYLTRKEQ